MCCLGVVQAVSVHLRKKGDVTDRGASVHSVLNPWAETGAVCLAVLAISAIQLIHVTPAAAQADYEAYIGQCAAQPDATRASCDKQLATSCGVLAVTSKGGVPDTYTGICAQRPDMESCGAGETLLQLDKGTCMSNDFLGSLCGGEREGYDGKYGAIFYDQVCAAATQQTPETPAGTPRQPEPVQPEPQQPEAVSPSFNCNRARLRAEKAICANPEVAALDNTMADLFVNRRRRLGGAQRHALTRQQQRWLRQRNSCGSNVTCLIRTYQQRIKQLQ